ncbi:MAG: FtsH protease activity modulator HflK [Alphaproteobacteria bacterium]
MPWKNQSGGNGPWGGDGGGPWGGGGGSGNDNNQGGSGGPWGSGGGGGRGPNQPGFDDLIRQGQDRMKRLLPGGLFGGAGIILIVIAVIVIWFGSGFYRVEPGEQGVVLRFGEHVATTGPGLNFHWPSPIEAVEVVDVLQERQTVVGVRNIGVASGSQRDSIEYVIGESRMVTSDENLIDLGFVVVWDIKDAADFLFQVENPHDVVRRISESALRETVAQTEIAQLILRSGDSAEAGANAREAVRLATTTRLQSQLDEYRAGINVRDVLLQGGDPPAEVIQSFRDVDIAEQNADRQRNQATAYANRIKEEVGGQVQRILEDARSYAASVTAEADGQAARFNQVLAAYWQSPDVVRQRLYIDTLGTVLANIDKIILESDSIADSVVPYLPLSELQNRPRSNSQQGGATTTSNAGQGGNQ